MDDHSFLSTEPSRLDGMSLHDALPHQLRETRTPPLAGPSSHDPVYTTVGTYGEYPIPYNNSSLPTPVSGAGSPETPESTQELPMVKHEPGTGDHDSPRSTSRAEWHYENSVSYHSHPHSPGTLHHQSHGYAMYDGLEGSDEPDIHRPAATEPSFWPSPALTTEVMPYSMDMNSSAMVRHDMPLAPNLHALQTPHHQSHLYRQSHDTYERNYHASASSSNDLGGVAQSYPQYHHAQPSLVVNEHKAETRDASRSSKSRSQKASRRSSGARRIRNKRATPRPRDNSDDRPEQYPLNPEERIALDDNVKEQDRYLYELRCELGAFNGEDMWDQIVQRYAEKYAPKRKATLQMQLNRALAKHQVWPESERALLADVMRDIVPVIRQELERRGGSRAMTFCNEQILAQLVREGHISVDNELSSSSPGARRTKLMIPRYNKSRSASHCDLKSHDQLLELTAEQLDYIMGSEAQRDLASHESGFMHNGLRQHGFMDSEAFLTSTASHGNTTSQSMKCQEAAYSKEAYEIAVGNGSVAPI